MKLINTKILTVASFTGLLGYGQAQIADTITIDFNNVSALISDEGYLFQDEYNGTANYEIPKGSGINTIYSMGAWFAGLDDNGELKLAQDKFGFGTIVGGPMADSIFYDSSTYLNKYQKSIWSVTDQEIQNHIANYSQPGYVVPQSLMDWPGNGDVSMGVAYDLAPYVDVNSDSQYDPTDGDYPDIRGDQAVYVIMNDHYTDTSVMDMSMGIEIHLMVYQYAGSGYLDNTTFLNYRVYNRSGNDYSDYRQTLYADMDLGNYADDYVGCDTLNHVGFTYNGDAFDEASGGNQGYEANPPCQGIVTLSHEMSGFNYFTSSSLFPLTDPNSPFGYWNIMNNMWLDGTPLVYGGTGGAGSAGSTLTPTNYAFSGFPEDTNGWSESTPGGGVIANPAGDRRFVMHIAEDFFPANTSKCSDYAIIYDRSGDILDNVQGVIDIAGQLRADYTSQNGYPCFSSAFNAVEENGGAIDFAMYPNPSNGALTIELPEMEGSVLLEVVDLTGRVVFENTFQNTDHISIQLNESNGIYLVKASINSHSLVKRLILNN